MMADCMIFPDDPFDFIDEYSFEDKDHVYTNGSKLIPAFRVKQALEHYFAKPSGWISVKDGLPGTSIEYIVCAIDEDGEQFVTSDHWLDTVRHWYLFDEHADSVVTHWMPMPEPPKEGDSE